MPGCCRPVLFLTAAFLLALMSPCSLASPGTGSRTATVDMQELFRGFYRTDEIQEEINLERARIQRKNREALLQLDELKSGIEALERKLATPGMLGPAAKGERRALEQELVLRQQEYQTRELKRRHEIEGRNRNLDQHMVARMGTLLDEIRREVARVGERAGFDYVFDRAGLNTSHVPPVLFAKEAADLTPLVLKELNKNKPRNRSLPGNDGR